MKKVTKKSSPRSAKVPARRPSSSPRKNTASKRTSSHKVEVGNKIRLNKFLADHGVASRRKADELIEEGRVQLNGKTVFELGVKVDPAKDSIKVGGKRITHRPVSRYFVFNKPKNVVTTNSDPEGRVTVMDYFTRHKERLFPVGRLDWDTEGLLLVTNDGAFANKIASPSATIPKTYHAKLDGDPQVEKLQKLTKGVSIVGGKVKAIEAVKLKKGAGKKAWVQITITEGKNRQIKKMFEKIGFDVVKLRRVAIGKLKLAGLKIGESRPLTTDDMERLFQKAKVDRSTKIVAGADRPQRKSPKKKNKTSNKRPVVRKKTRK